MSEVSAEPMPRARLSWWDRLDGFFGVDEAWERPRPAITRRDVLLGLAAEVTGLVLLELLRSMGVLNEVAYPWWSQWLAVSSAALLLIGRRRWPITVALLAAAHMVVTGVIMPEVMSQLSLQVFYFLAFLSAVSWARDRRAMMLAVAFILLVMFGWIALQFAVGNTIQQMVDSSDGLATGRHGVIAPIPAAVLLTVIVNIMYFGGAIIGGQVSWNNARAKALLAHQARTIADQSESLRDQALTEERLRIARDLHDVVAHHVSVIGIQAGAARRVLESNPVAAQRALSEIEKSTREAVASMRGLLGTLRGLSSVGGGESDRGPQPSVGELSALVEQHQSPGCQITLEVVESEPGLLGRLPAPIAHSVYRTVQEALANVTRHSTASQVSATVRLTSGPAAYAEVEVLDNGRPRAGTSGSGLGQLGIRERAVSHRGEVEIGPRTAGGYRVRVRFPLTSRAHSVGGAA